MRKNLLLILLFILGIGMEGAMAQERIITGKVTAKEDGQGIPGANVIVQGTSRGVNTDADGNFKLTLEAADNALVFSFVGYQTQIVTIGVQTDFNIVLESDAKDLQEVVVVGYGVQRKSDLTGAISSIKANDITKIPSFDPVQSLQGKIAGVQVYNSSGAPGSLAVVRVRGVGTFNNASPIYVVDGVILDDISFLNSSDIQSMEVLKDASATAIYGARGANGVIIVTTKLGKQGQASVINVSADYSLQQISKQIDMLNGREFATVNNVIQPGTFNNLDKLPNTNWQSLIFRVAPMQTFQLSTSGSSEKSQYYFGVSYYNQQGIIPKSSYQRIAVKFNNTYFISKGIKVGNNITMTPYQQQNAPDVVSQAYRAQPTIAPYYPDSSTYQGVRNVGNPLATLAYSNDYNKGIRMVGNMFGEVTFLKDFLFRSSFGVDLAYNKSSSFSPAYAVYYPNGTASQQTNYLSNLAKGSSDTETWLWENTVTYNKRIGDHRLNLLGGYTVQQTKNEFINIAGSNLLRNAIDLQYLNSPSYFYNLTASPQPVNTLNKIGNGVNADYYYSMMSFLFRTNYTYQDKYLMTVSFRRDGSSKFSKSNRFGNFPSAAIGWNMINEDFMKQVKVLSNLKIRASWGIIGNEKIPYTSQFSTVISNASTGPVFGSANNLNSGATFAASGNPDLKWETTHQTDVGLEVGFLNNRLTGEFDYFSKTTKDILVALHPASYLGNGPGATIWYNAGSVLNRGLEFNVAWQDEFKSIRYRVAFMGNTLHNEVLTIGGNKGIDSTLVDGYIADGRAATLSRKGLPIGAFYGYKTNGIFQNANELASYPHDSQAGVGDLRFVDVNKDGKINASDRTYLGSPIPTLVYGFNFNIGYKNFDLSTDFQGQRGNVIFNAKELVRPDPYNFEKHVINYWHGEGTSNTEPRPFFGGYNYSISDKFMQSASYLRLRSITFSYSLPKSIAQKLYMKQVKAYVRATNLFTISKFTGYTPDLGSGSVLANNIDTGTYPVPKVYSIGFNLTF